MPGISLAMTRDEMLECESVAGWHAAKQSFVDMRSQAELGTEVNLACYLKKYSEDGRFNS